jgi:hypothetical protein
MRMKVRMRGHIAAAVIAALVASSLPGCSKPIDPNSSIPPIYQPLVFVLAAVGVGIALTALHHHNEKHSGGGPPPGLAGPFVVTALGNQPFDMALDPSQPGGVGALGRVGGGGNYGFLELGSSAANNGSYQLPSGYQPRAVAIDGSGNDWFVNDAGTVIKCSPPVASVTNCTPLLNFSDGLASSGVRSIAAESTHVFIALDNQAGTVFWVAFALDGSGRLSGSYSYSPGLGTYSKDAVVAASGTVATYTIFHRDGNSYALALPGPATKNSFTFSPVPLGTGNIANNGATSGPFYGFLGSATSGNYEIGNWVGPGNSFSATPGTLHSTITIAFNGQTSPNAAPYVVPLTSAHTDGFSIFTLDSSGNLVVFTAFP